MGNWTARGWLLAGVLAGVGLGVGLPAPAAEAQAPEPYRDPPFAADCTVVDFGPGESPAPGELDHDPLCVRYDKTEITVDDGGALAFLGGEHERVIAALPACRYWQQDRWRIQISQDGPTLVGWDGSYWYDRGAGTGGAIVRDFQIAGQPAGADQVADVLEPVDAEMAAAIRAYGAGPGGGGGVSVDLGGGEPTCTTSEPSDPGDADGVPDGGDVAAPGSPPPPTATDGSHPRAAATLPATGGAGPSPAAALALLVAGAATGTMAGRARR